MGVRMLSPQRVAKDWGVSPRTVQRLASSGRLAAVKVGRQWRIPETAADAYVTAGAAPEQTA